MKHVRYLLAGIGVLTFLLFFWPGMYRYDRHTASASQSYIVRINRVTGNVDALVPAQGWRRLGSASTPDTFEPAVSDLRGATIGFALGCALGWAITRKRRKEADTPLKRVWDNPEDAAYDKVATSTARPAGAVAAPSP